MCVTSRALAVFAFGVVTLTACSDGTSPEDAVPTTLALADSAVVLTELGATFQIGFSVLDQNGEAISSPDATYSSSDLEVATVSAAGLVTAVRNGASRVSVSVGTLIETVLVTVDAGPVALAAGVPVQGLSGERASTLFFTFEVPEGGPNRVLQVRLTAGLGDADVAIRHDVPPSFNEFDCVSTTEPGEPDSLEFCGVVDPDPGTWHVLVAGFTSYAGVVLQADLLAATPLADGETLSDVSGDRAEILYFRFDVPGAAAGGAGVAAAARSPEVFARGDRSARGPFAGRSAGSGPLASTLSAAVTGALRVTTGGGSGDPDVVATTAPLFSISNLGTERCVSASNGPEEVCEVTDPSAGRWTVLVVGFTPFSGLTVSADFEPAGAMVQRADDVE